MLEDAHNLPHGTPGMLSILEAANALGPELAAALDRYQKAVADLKDFYINRSQLHIPELASGSRTEKA
jgi:hypothetical protein